MTEEKNTPISEGGAKVEEPEKVAAVHHHRKKRFELKRSGKGGLIIAIIALIIVGAAAYYIKNRPIDIGSAAAKKDVVDFVSGNLVQPGTKVDVKNVSKAGSLYKVTITVGGQDIDTYITQDGKTFFPNAMDIAAAAQNQSNPEQAAQAQQPVPKSDVPDVKLFVMSYCPYGTQMEKGLLPVLDALGSKIKFTLEFVDYSMHNDKSKNDRKELDENLRQYCIEKNQPQKLDAYLACFLEKGQGNEASCMASAGINAAQVSSCAAQTDNQYDVTKDWNDQSTWVGQFPPFNVNKDDNVKYGVQGSPTLVINGVQAQANRDPESLLKTICGAFNNQPAACSKTLSSTSPSPGFGGGSGSSSGSGSASCGN